MDKQTFMLQFILNARLSGRSQDVDGENYRKKIVDCAEDLWNKVGDRCKEVEPRPPVER